MTKCSCKTRGITLKAIFIFAPFQLKIFCRMMAPDKRTLVPHAGLLFYICFVFKVPSVSMTTVHQDPNQASQDTFWSPSEVIGLSTPPTTPALSSLETSLGGTTSSQYGMSYIFLFVWDITLISTLFWSYLGFLDN